MADNKIHEIRIIKKETKKEAQAKAKKKGEKPRDEELAVLEWEAPEFIYHQKDLRWYIISALISAVFIVYGMMTQNFFFIVLVVVAQLLILFWGEEKSPLAHYIIDEKGITINDVRHPFSRLRWYAIDEEADDIKKLIVEQKARFSRRFYIYLDSPEFENDIRNALRKKVPENVEYEEHFTDSLAKKLRF